MENFVSVSFSTKTGWMNDINGLVFIRREICIWFTNGEKHKACGYATKYGFAFIGRMKGGRTNSLKNLFYPKKPFGTYLVNMFFPGSALLFQGKCQNGLHLVLKGSNKIAIYIRNRCRDLPCMEYDKTAEPWSDYKNNPVANRTKGANLRDPCVFLPPPNQKMELWLFTRRHHFLCF